MSGDVARMEEAVINDDPRVQVRRQFNDDRLATYRLSKIEGLHWSNVSGGVLARANREYLHGYVWCNEMEEGELAHSCRHGSAPHRIKVCITEKGNEAVFPRLLEMCPRKAR